MELISFKNSLDDFINEAELMVAITDKISRLPNFQALRFDVELTKYVANVVENAFHKRTPEEKKVKTRAILQNIFQYDVNEILIIDKQLIFLADNKKIKKKGFLESTKIKTCHWFEKKFG
jgi:hypothetical protein